MKKHYRKENNCLNCGSIVTGKYCSNCGQENLDLKEPFWHFVSHSVSHYFHFDSKFFHTLKPLLARPGQLTLDYMAGKRTRYLHPVSMYIFVSIIYFLVVPAINKHEEKEEKKTETTQASSRPDSLKLKNDSIKNPTSAYEGIRIIREGLDKSEISEEFQKLSLSRQALYIDSLKKAQKLHPADSLKDQIKSYQRFYNRRNDTTYQAYLDRQNHLPENERDGWFSRLIKKRDFEIKNKTGGSSSLQKEYDKYSSKLYFILMPLFAFFLMLKFKKNGKYYIEHLIFTIHFFTAFFIFTTVTDVIKFFLINGTLKTIFSLIVWAAIMWYIYRALRVFYQRKRWVTIRKLISLSILYLIAYTFSWALIQVYIYIIA